MLADTRGEVGREGCVFGGSPAQQADDLCGSAVLSRRGVARVPGEKVRKVDFSVPVGVHGLHEMLHLGLVQLVVSDGVWQRKNASAMSRGLLASHMEKFKNKTSPARF